MKNEFSIINTTPGGQQTIYFIMANISIEEFKSCIDEERIRNLCRSGCVNYGAKWSCPPFSPKISDIIERNSYNSAIIITAYILLADMNYIKNSYQQVKAANMILKSKCEKYARTLEKLTGGYALLSGSCNLCKPCYKKRGLPCGKPDAKRYSLESTGINVTSVSARFCNHELLWYKKGEFLPYTSVVMAVLYNSEIPFDYMAVMPDGHVRHEEENTARE